MATAKQIESLRQSFCRFLRFGNQLMRGKASCCPITMEQYHTLEALLEESKSMKELSSEVGFHQSTMTRIVEKLSAQQLVLRTRKRSNQRNVDVQITDKGRQICLAMRDGCSQMISWLLDAIPTKERTPVVKSMEILTDMFSPDNNTFQEMYKACCCRSNMDLEK